MLSTAHLPLSASRILRSSGDVLSLVPNASAWGLRAMNGGDPLVIRVRRSVNVDGESHRRDFYASELENGTLLSWVTAASSTADGFVDILYDQSNRNFHWYSETDNFNAPKIVVSGNLSRDTENKLAINGNGAKLRLGPDNQTTNTNFFSSDGTWSVFLVTDFPDYSGATNSNVQIVHFESETNGGANSPRKPVISCNKSFNQLAVAQPTQTVGSNTIGNIFLPTYPGEQLFSNFGNPALSADNNEGFLDAAGRGGTGHAFTNASTAVNTDTNALSVKNVLFMPTETGVTTFLTALIYVPSYAYSQKTNVENKLISIYDLTLSNYDPRDFR